MNQKNGVVSERERAIQGRDGAAINNSKIAVPNREGLTILEMYQTYEIQNDVYTQKICIHKVHIITKYFVCYMYITCYISAS